MKRSLIFAACLGLMTMSPALATTAKKAGAAPAAVPTLSTELLLQGGAPENVALSRFLARPVSDPQELAGKRVAILTTDGVENIELVEQLRFFRQRGATADVVAPRFVQPEAKWGLAYPAERKTHILTVRFMDNAEWVKIDRFLEDVSTQDYDAVVIPGGTWNPDTLRILPQALQFVRAMHAAGKVTAAICHGPLVFINAGIVKGKAATATWNVQLDMTNAGAKLRDEPVVVDGQLITSRHPLDLPQFLTALENALRAK